MRARSYTPSNRNALTYLVDAAILAALWSLFFWRFLTPNQVDQLRFGAGDFIYQYFSPASYLAQRLGAGTFPLWGPFAYAGHPFIGDIQNAAFYPFRLLNAVLNVHGGLTARGLEIEVLLHHLLATLFTYLLTRRLTGSRIGGLVGAITFGFSGFLTGYPLLQANFIESLAWLPLLLWSWDQAGERWGQRQWRSVARWVLLAGVVLGVSILAGSPQFTLYTVYGTVIFAIFRLWVAGIRSRQDWAGALGAVIGFVGFGLGLASIQLLPAAGFLPLTLRSAIGFEEAGRGFTPYDWLQVIFPAIGGEFQALYVGMLAPGLVVVALAVAARDPMLPRDRRLTIGFFGWSGLAAALLAFGKHMSVFSLPYLLAPGWGLFRQQERTIAWTVLAVALLAGYGAAWLSHAWRREELEGSSASVNTQDDDPGSVSAATEKRLLIGYGVATLVAFGLALVFFVGYQAGREQLWGFTAASMYLALVLALAYVGLRSRRPWLLVALLALDLFTVNAGRHGEPGPDAAAGGPPPALSAPLADTDTFRTANEILPGNYGALYGLEDIDGISPLVLKQYRQWRDALPPARTWNLLNVKYVLTWREALDAPAERIWEGTGADGKPAFVYRLAEVGPRARLVGMAVVEPDPAKAIERTAAPDFDPAQEVVLPWMPAGFGSAAQCDGEIRWQNRQPEQMALAVDATEACILVLGELDIPGWQATLDGQPTAILLANGLLRAMAVPSGAHAVTLTYRPPLLRLGALFSLATLALVAISYLVVSLARRPSMPAARD